MKLASMALAWLFLVQPAAAGNEIAMLLATLHRAQDDLANTGETARPVHDRIMTMLDARVAAAANDGTIETDDLVRYALSGGDPRIARKALSQISVTAREAILVRGALAHVSGRSAEARRLLGLIDPERLRGRLAGLVTMAKAGAAARAGASAEATPWLQRVRLVAPGTLIEEAALRRLAAIALASGDEDGFLRLSRQYWRRFPRSAFRRQMLETTRIGLLRVDETKTIAALQGVTAGMPKALRTDLYTTLARAAVIDGRRGLAEVTTAKTNRATAPMRLMRSLSRLTGSQADEAERKLANFDVTDLTEDDRHLLAAGNAMARAIHAPVKSPGAILPTRSKLSARLSPGLAAVDVLLDRP